MKFLSVKSNILKRELDGYSSHNNIVLYSISRIYTLVSDIDRQPTGNRHGIFISVDVRAQIATRFPHPTGIIVGRGVRIGDNVTIFQNVTLGGKKLGDGRAGRYPRIGDGATPFAGAVIVGDIAIGAGSVVGANSVVLDDIPDRSIAVGAPARTRPLNFLP